MSDEKLQTDEPQSLAQLASEVKANEPDRSDGREDGGEPDHPFYVVGIGASAGGLEALAELLKNVPVDCMAFVVVQHLAPQHESVLTELLGRTSRVEVLTARDGMTLEPNHVYVIPPNTDLAVMHGVLHLLAPAAGTRPRLTIDFFFRSLADDRGSHAIGIVLSGTGTDGTVGLEAIKTAGGITFAQEPSSARYDGMPRSAVASGHADFCLTPTDIGHELSRIGKQHYAPIPPRTTSRLSAGPERLAKLLVLVRAEFGTDLTYYKAPTIERRIERRMALHKIAHFDDYLHYVQTSSDELRELYKDMLITVTSFFRDRDPFDALKSKIFPAILQHKETQAPVRVWVPACATGEEAYSIAICLLEFLEQKTLDTKVQIFGTDIDDGCIQQARRGVYPESIADDVSPDRLNRFFVKKDGTYQINRRIRDMVIFSKQNVLKDAPFSKIDLVSCRNLLIYFQPIAQKKTLRILHYALNPFGFLLLGTSETVGDAPDLFSLIDRKLKLYSKKHVGMHAPLDVAFGASQPPQAVPSRSAARPILSLQGLVDRKVLELYGPPGAVINEHLETLHFRGHTGPYLDPSPGAPSFNVLRLVRPDLHVELAKVIQEAQSTQLRASAEVSFYEAGKPTLVKLDVVPIQEPETKARCFLVLFHAMAAPKEVPVVVTGNGATNETNLPLARRIQELERELAVTKEYLQTTIEEREGFNEELKSANEELQSSNEELQSTNEELETSKEEMQSSNEELTTMNDELKTRMGELALTYDDLHNVLGGVDSAVVIVGIDLRIRRYTASAEKLFHLVAADVGRSVAILERFLGLIEIENKVRTVIDTLSSVESEILISNRRWFSLRITPYKTLDHFIRGAVVVLTDIDVRKKVGDLTRDVGDYADKFLAAIGHPLLMLDSKLRIVWANEPFYDSFKLAKEETVGSLFLNVGSRQWADPKLRELLETTLATGEGFRDFRIRHRFHEIGERTLKLGASRVPSLGESALALLSVEQEPPESLR